MSGTVEIVYTWEDGREEVRYRRLYLSDDAIKFISEVEALQEAGKQKGYISPYSYRIIK